MDTSTREYAEYYLKKYHIWWRFWTPLEVPFKYFAKCLCKGKTLDVGCGPGRYLSFLSNATGIDHNPCFVGYARDRGFDVYSNEDFEKDFDHHLNEFDTLLFSHILEHMEFHLACKFVEKYLPTLKKDGRIVIIVPHGICYHNDPSHICYLDCKMIKELASVNNLNLIKEMYHPFPEWLSRWIVNDAAFILKQK